MLHSVQISHFLLIVRPGVPSVIDSGIVKFLTTVVQLSVSFSNSAGVCSMYFGALLLGAYVFIIVTSFGQIDLFSLQNVPP